MNAFTQALGLRWPIIQAPMAGVQGSALALAVCQAGGLGSLPAAMLGAQALRAELRLLQASGLPYNVNVFCHQPPVPEPAREAQWLRTLSPYYQALGLPLPGPSGPPSRQPFDAAMAELLAEFAPPVLSFHFGLPSPALVQRVKAWGAQVWASATTLDEALWLQQHGADAVIAQGLEAGGHRGHFLNTDVRQQPKSLDLLPALLAALHVPVLAAGGFASPERVRAALDLGAAAVQVGSAFLCANEAQTAPWHRAALQQPGARETHITNLFSGGAARGLVNRLMRELGPWHPAAPAFPLASAALAPLRAAAEATGCADFSPLWCGQSDAVFLSAPAARIVHQLMGAEAA